MIQWKVLCIHWLEFDLMRIPSYPPVGRRSPALPPTFAAQKKYRRTPILQDLLLPPGVRLKHLPDLDPATRAFLEREQPEVVTQVSMILTNLVLAGQVTPENHRIFRKRYYTTGIEHYGFENINRNLGLNTSAQAIKARIQRMLAVVRKTPEFRQLCEGLGPGIVRLLEEYPEAEKQPDRRFAKRMAHRERVMQALTDPGFKCRDDERRMLVLAFAENQTSTAISQALFGAPKYYRSVQDTIRNLLRRIETHNKRSGSGSGG